jgi:hypothetical protein
VNGVKAAANEATNNSLRVANEATNKYLKATIASGTAANGPGRAVIGSETIWHEAAIESGTIFEIVKDVSELLSNTKRFKSCL